MEKVNINLATYIFNFLELTSIVILGIINKISIEIIVAVMIIFMFVRQNKCTINHQYYVFLVHY